MTDIEQTIANITKSSGRKSAFHFTRAANLQGIARFDAIWSSQHLLPESTGERRLSKTEVDYKGITMTVNSHLRIPEAMMEENCTVEQFRSFIDRHIFFWPTKRDCLAMLTTYMRREPAESFAVLEFDASELLLEHQDTVRLSKYDSGSSPRFPSSCNYRKSPAMFVSLAEFGYRTDYAVPAKPSEIKEILIEEQAHSISRLLKSVYALSLEHLPTKWLPNYQPLDVLLATSKTRTD
ncbi:DUF7002 family protein [Paenibacillus glycanilyticus]|uniref:DUF4433 domain-containing protein n=1 Tax=Paenibacillus glycanilyticus TaxID=126569 RepID=A0ABQ6G8X2_9BACL|nr:hypothetical protein [Paenibacillus glycanilyticus]GLX67396.1 hypothetical protein MU1_17410 [Paenibacillus glycanilyticus]